MLSSIRKSGNDLGLSDSGGTQYPPTHRILLISQCL